MTAQAVDDDGAFVVAIDWTKRLVPRKVDIRQLMELLADPDCGPEHSGSIGRKYALLAGWAQCWDAKLARLLREHARTGQELREYAQLVLEQ